MSCLFSSGLFDEVHDSIKNWKPRSNYAREIGYKRDLLEYLRRGFGRNHSIQEERGRSLADIGIDRKIGIELKLNLSGRAHQLNGEVHAHIREYTQGVIVVLCGKTNPNTLDEVKNILREKIREERGKAGILSEGKRIKLIVTDQKNTTNTVKSNPFLDWNPFR